MKVLKFGGTSVADASCIKKSAAIVQRTLNENLTVVVVSAFGGITDMLIDAGKKASVQNENYREILRLIENRHLETVRELLPISLQSGTLSLVKKKCNELESICEGAFLVKEISPRTLDSIVSYGEILSSLIISAFFRSLGLVHRWIDSRLLLVTDSNYGSASVDFVGSNQLIKKHFSESPESLFILPGFIGSDSFGNTTTLGRGGSDYTASVIAAALDASVLEIWTDVSGMMTSDPRLVSNAKPIPRISYQEAMELSHFGAKVIYPPTIQPVMSKGIPVWIKNTFAPEDEGTLIESKVGEKENIVRGLSSINKIALLGLEGSGMIGIPGTSKRLFEALSKEKINVILITQASSEHSICVGIDEINSSRAKEIVDAEFSYEISTGKIEPLNVETGLSIIAVVGDNMKNHPGISGKMFGSLGNNGVNIRAIAQGSSEKNISAVIQSSDVKKAINVLHEEFFETVFKQINVFVAGTGNVGSRLVEQILNQQDFLKEHLRLNLRVVGISNSKNMLMDENGIDLSDWKQQLSSGKTASFKEFLEFMYNKNLRNSVFADITSSVETTNAYKDLFRKSISVVACNKLACSSDFNSYKELKHLSREYNAPFLFETNVGAGLPVISTLNDLIRSGDKILKIEAVLSGTLNFVFNNYNGTQSFSKIVKQAQEQGFTEPDPRLDLGGTDVMRKILILAREAGFELEFNEINNNTFLPASCMNGEVDDFYLEMEKQEKHFKSLYDKSIEKNCKLKFVAKLENGKASVGLNHISPDNDLFHLYGKDNVVLFYTERYPKQPLVIKGAGAGADVTASGIFADIIRTAGR